MRQPSIEQLRNITDRAYRGQLRPEEVARLRAGIDQLAARRLARPGTAPWARRLHTLRRKLAELHYPVQHERIAACAECSGWNGRRCTGLITQWPCPTLATVDDSLPQKRAA